MTATALRPWTSGRNRRSPGAVPDSSPDGRRRWPEASLSPISTLSCTALTDLALSSNRGRWYQQAPRPLGAVRYLRIPVMSRCWSALCHVPPNDATPRSLVSQATDRGGSETDPSAAQTHSADSALRRRSSFTPPVRDQRRLNASRYFPCNADLSPVPRILVVSSSCWTWLFSVLTWVFSPAISVR